MGYSYHLAASSTLLVVLAFVVYIARHRLPSGIRTRLGLGERGMLGSTPSGMGGAGRGLYSHIPAYDWTTSRLAGLHSTLFDIEANVRGGDTRVGLEGAGAAEIERLMQTQGVDFDTARLMLNQARFSKNNIDPRTGMPLDSKAVTFENLR